RRPPADHARAVHQRVARREDRQRPLARRRHPLRRDRGGPRRRQLVHLDEAARRARDGARHGLDDHADAAAGRRRRRRPRRDVRVLARRARAARRGRPHCRPQPPVPRRRRRRRGRRDGRRPRPPPDHRRRLTTRHETTKKDPMTNDSLPTIGHWIDGAPRASKSGRTAPVYNPATGEQIANVALADQAEIDEAIASAQRGFETWSNLSIAKRQNVLFAFRELLNARKGELAQIITREHGKVVSDAMGEILRGQEVVELATGFPHLIKGAFSENASTGIDVYSIKQPLGVVGIISPFNFPVMVPMWFFPVAIAAGNAVVLKPSEKDPSAALWLAELWKEAG